MIDDANKFVIQEIARLKKQLEDTDKDISNVKKNIKGLIQN
jgi:regulator of replication initiation timing